LKWEINGNIIKNNLNGVMVQKLLKQNDHPVFDLWEPNKESLQDLLIFDQNK
jgi:hypothetical protein